MYQNACNRAVALACAISSSCVLAQSISFSPSSPSGGQIVVATLSEPFNCAAPQPTLKASSANSFTFESILPYGPVNCPLIPFPPPTTSNFSASLGPLLPGSYALNWNIYQQQASGTPLLLSSTSAAILVGPALALMPISPGFTGNWFDPAASGHGFSIEVLPDERMLVQWYVFGTDGGQTWIVATGPISGDHAVLDGYYPVGPGARFPPNLDPSQLQNELWGTITLTFQDCDHGVVSWTPTAASGYPAGTMPITRLTLPAGLSCP